MDNSQSSIFKCQDYSNLQYSFHLLEQLDETIERIFKTFNLSIILHVEFVSRCIRNCSDDADGISKVMFSGDGREGVNQPAGKPASKQALNHGGLQAESKGGSGGQAPQGKVSIFC